MLAEHLETKVWEIVDSYYPKGDWAHGRSHIERVLRTAVELGKREGADLEIIELSAILHDIFANEEKRRGVEGFRHEVIAETLGIAVGTSKAQLHRARMMLRKHLTR